MKKYESMQNKAERAMKSAVRDVVERHKKSGRPIPVWENGKTVMISPDNIPRKK
jgi:hypothetical protein